MKQKSFFSKFSQGDIASNSGDTLNNVSLMATGDALGHGMSIDRRSIETVLEHIENGKLKSFENHNYNPNPTDILGVFSGFSIVDTDDGISKLVAEKFEFLASADAEKKARLIELATKAPEVFGCSLTAECDAVWVVEDGSEVSSWERPPNCTALSRVARFGVVYSCDFVSDPACNPSGLFSQNQNQNQQKDKTMKRCMQYFATRFADKPQLFSKAYKKIEAFAEGEEIDEKKIADEIENEETIDGLKKENAELKTKIKALEEKIAEAESAKEKAESEKAELSAKIQNVSGAENFETETQSVQLSAEIQEWNKKMDEAQLKGDIVEIQRLNQVAVDKKFF